MKNPSIYLHIGSYKTGTTSLQRYFHTNSEKLLCNNVLYPQSIINIKMEAQHEFSAWADNFNNDFSVVSLFNVTTSEEKIQFDKDVFAYYSHLLKDSYDKNQSLLLSTEYIFDLSIESLARIKHFFKKDPRELKIILYLRRVDLLMISAYYHHILTGVHKTDRPVFNKYDPLLKFKEKLLVVSEIFGKENIIIRPFDKTRFVNGNLIDDFLSILEIDNSGFKSISDANIGLSSIEATVLVEASNTIKPFLKIGETEVRNPEYSKLINKLQQLKLESTKDMLVSKVEALNLYNQFKDDYRLIQKEYLPNYPHDTLFNEDFSMYEEEYKPLDLTFEQGAEIMLALWDQDFSDSYNKSAKISFIEESSQTYKRNQSIEYTIEEKIVIESDYFDEEWYLKEYPDILNAEVDPVKHYCAYGWKERRNPSERFNTSYYLENNQDVLKAKSNPLLHFLQLGNNEARHPISKKQREINARQYINLIRDSEFFDEEWYSFLYPDIEASGCDSAEHFYNYGYLERRTPSPKYNIYDYVRHYPEVRKSSLNPIVYYLLVGQRKGHIFFSNHTELSDIMPALQHKSINKTDSSIDLVVLSNSENGNELLNTLLALIENTPFFNSIYILSNNSISSRIKELIKEQDNKIQVFNAKKNQACIRFGETIKNSSNHFIFLHSGIIVPQNWTNRILSPFFEDDTIFSVQPLVHHDTLTGFNSSVPDDFNLFDLDVNSIDNSLSAFSGYKIDTHARHCLCVALNNNILSKIIDQKFIENFSLKDLMLSAEKKGYKNTITPGVFVRNEIEFVSTETEGVISYPAEKKMNQFHFFSLLTLGATQLGKGIAIIFDHPHNRSVTKYSGEIILTKRRLQPVCVVQYNAFSNQYQLHVCVNDIDLRIDLDNLKYFWEICRELPLEEIIINDIKEFPFQLSVLEEILELSKKKTIDIKVSIHDYNAICPKFSLLDYEGFSCSQRNDVKRCGKCIADYEGKIADESVNIDKWRNIWGQILDSSKEIQVFSSYSLSLIKEIYPDLKKSQFVTDKPELIPLRSPEIKKGTQIHIGVIGNIDYKNGSKVVLSIHNYLKRNKLGKLTVIGIFKDKVKPDFNITGEFHQDRLPEMIEQKGINVCFVPTIWPNPQSYVFEEIQQMDIPFVAFDSLKEEKEEINKKNRFIAYGTPVSKIANELVGLWENISEEDIPGYLIDKKAPEDFYEEKVLYKSSSSRKSVKLLAYHLPQFYTFPENDEWWGEGFTEWTNVTKAKPLFKGHYQPRVPHDDIGYYHLDKIDHIRKQAELVHNYGLYGLCFYHYWFDGKRLMDKPVDLLLENKDINLKFCLCWANEGWTRSWDGDEKNVLIAQSYNQKNDTKFIKDLRPYIEDSRYIRVDGKPLIHVYRIDHMPFPRRTTEVWRQWCRENGLGEIYLVGTAVRGIKTPQDYGFDALVNRPFFNWHIGQMVDCRRDKNLFLKNHKGVIQHYNEVAEFYKNHEVSQANGRMLRSVGVMWDTSARHSDRCLIVDKSNPEDYQKWLEKEMEYTKKNIPESEQFVFLNAWNEWAEGAYLEPDTKYGYAFLNATARALKI